MIKRLKELNTLRRLLQRYPVVGILGARQGGKTTLSRAFIEKSRGPSSFFDLGNAGDYIIRNALVGKRKLFKILISEICTC